MMKIQEISERCTRQAATAMLALRPRWGSADALVELIDLHLRPHGYRLIGVFLDEDQPAVAVAGFREMTTLAWGRYLYVDDLSTLPAERNAGHGARLMTWLVAEAERLGCEGVHLDSGVSEDRAAAHRLYMRHKLRISAHHFQRSL